MNKINKMKTLLIALLVITPITAFAANRDFVYGSLESGYNVGKEVWDYAFNQQNINTSLRKGQIKVYKFTDGDTVCYNSVTFANEEGTIYSTSLSCK